MIVVSCSAWERKTWVFAPTFYFGKKQVVNRSKLAEKVREIAKVAAENESLELVHVEVVGSGKKQTVRIYIDHENGITHDHCSAVSQQVGKALDADDPVSNTYILEVSSPGVERGLYSLKDFERFKGQNSRLKTHTAINNQKNFRGVILGVIDESVNFNDRTNGEVEIPFENIKKAKLEFDFEQEFNSTKKHT